jgi:integrase
MLPKGDSGMKLTDQYISGLKAPPSGRAEFPDELVTGLRLRIGANSKTWVLRARVNEKVINATLGRYPALSLAKAREAARSRLIAYEQDDPVRSKLSIEIVATDFIERHCKPKNRRWEDQQAMLNRYVLPRWKGRDIGDVRKRDVVQLIDAVIDGGVTVMANRVLAVVHKLFAWAVSRDIIEHNPATGVAKPVAEVPRDRVLTTPEVRAIWKATTHMAYPHGAYIRLLLLSAQRRDEVATMRWSAIDLEKATWKLDAADTKAARAHIVPLSKTVLDILAQLPRLDDYVLTTRAGTHICGYSKSKELLDRFMAAELGIAPSELPNWRIHDLRRTVATRMVGLGIMEEVVGKVLNHARQGVTARHYNHHAYINEKRHALDLWAAELMRIVDGVTGESLSIEIISAVE